MKKINKITEGPNPKSSNIDQKDINEILHIINNEDQIIPSAIKKVIPEVSQFIEKVVQKLDKSGRLIYAGSGTSGRLGILDASECSPTFGVSKDLVIGIIAGGDKALKESIEGAEDDLNESTVQLKNINLIKPTLHRYLAGYTKSQFRRIDANEFTIATLLPVQRFKKATDNAVWKESRSMI